MNRSSYRLFKWFTSFRDPLRFTASYAITNINRPMWMINTGMALTLATASYSYAEAKDENKSLEDTAQKYVERRRIITSKDPVRLFKSFASEIKDDHQYMTTNDFLNALLSFKYGWTQQLQINPKLIQELSKLIGTKEGLISCDEFCIIISLASVPSQHLKIAFRLFDEDNNGSLTPKELASTIEQICKFNRNVYVPKDSDMYRQLFKGNWMGSNSEKCTIDTLESYLETYNNIMNRIHFSMMVDEDEAEFKVSASGLLRLLVSNAESKSLPMYENKIKLIESNTPGAKKIKVDVGCYLNLQQVLFHYRDDLLDALKFTMLGKSRCSQEEFILAARVVSGIHLNRDAVSLMFSLFDEAGDGLSIQELESSLSYNDAAYSIETDSSDGASAGIGSFMSKFNEFTQCVRGEFDKSG